MNCQTCRHQDVHPEAHPCKDCVRGVWNKWESVEEAPLAGGVHSFGATSTWYAPDAALPGRVAHEPPAPLAGGIAWVPISSESDPHGIEQHAPGAKLDAGKVQAWLCLGGFAHALSAVALVTTRGAEKYSRGGWEKVPDGEARYMEAFGRHTLALGRGEVFDSDTDCMHKAQMIWNLLASLELELREAQKWGAK